MTAERNALMQAVVTLLRAPGVLAKSGTPRVPRTGAAKAPGKIPGIQC